MYVLWIILAIAFLIVEFGTVTLVSLWFVGGALAAMAADFLGAALWLQVLIFAGVSFLLLLLLRPFLRKFVDPLKVPTNVDAMIGKEAVVTEGIDNLAGTGAIKLDGKIWTARSANGAAIPAGMVVTVQAVEGVKAMVAPAFVHTV
jgi:membrane protein implicated in regulation of membrane protease activity